MDAHLHQMTTATTTVYPRNGDREMFCTLEFNCMTGKAVLFLHESQIRQADAIAAIFNGNVDALADRIESVMDNINDMDVTFSDFALAIACDLIGKDLDEALRERREAEDAA